MNKKKVVIGLGVTAVVVTIVALVVANKKKKMVSDTVVKSSKSLAPCVVFPLKIGSGTSASPCSNSQVKQLQIALNKKSYAPLTPLVVDGLFGEKTADRLDRLFKLRTLTQEQFNNVLSTFWTV